jgi:hypothetical protein
MNFFMVNPDDLPEGLREELKRQHDLHHMGHVQAIHEVRDFLHNLTREQLVTLRNMISGIVEGTVEDNERGAYALGKITELLDSKHGICGCGVDHDKEAEHLLTPKEEEAKKVDQPPITFTDHQGIFHTWKNGEWVAEPQDLAPDSLEPFGEPREALLKQYNVLDFPLQFPKVICAKDCGTTWVSLTDRMKRAPDECNGCQNKAAWG